MSSVKQGALLSRQVERSKIGLRKKYASLQKSLRDEERIVSRKLKPIVEPLTQIASSLTKNEELAPKGDEHNEGWLRKRTPDSRKGGRKREMSLESDETWPPEGYELEQEGDEATVIKQEGSDKEEVDKSSSDEQVFRGFSTPILTPLSHKQILAKRLKAVSHSDPGPTLSALRNAAKQESEYVQNKLSQFPKFMIPYLRYLLTQDASEIRAEIDEYYAPKTGPTGVVTLGAYPIHFSPFHIGVRNDKYPATPGLISLLFLKNPQQYTSEDFNHYSDLVRSSLVAHAGFDKTRPLTKLGSEKFKNIISKIYRSKTDITTETSKTNPTNQLQIPRLTRSQTLKLREKTGSGVLGHFRVSDQNLPTNPNRLVNLLRIYLSSRYSGNFIIQEKIHRILERLKSSGFIL